MLRVEYFSEITCPISQDQVNKIVKIASRKEKKIRGILEVTVVSDKRIKDINKKFRGKNSVTDVLSFSWLEGGAVPGELLGEVYICYPQIVRQAKYLSVPAGQEFARMLVHGLLHIVGYDHVKKNDSGVMFEMQEKIVREIEKQQIVI